MTHVVGEPRTNEEKVTGPGDASPARKGLEGKWRPAVP